MCGNFANGTSDSAYSEFLANAASNISVPKDGEISPQEAGKKLARLIEKQLGYCEGHIDNIALRLFIRAYWSQISHLAHIIHDVR